MGTSVMRKAAFAVVRNGARTRVLGSFLSSRKMSNVVEVVDDAHFVREIQEANDLAVADFTAVWCGPCRTIAPTFAAMSLEFPKVKFLKVDIDSESLEGTVQKAGISAVPTFQFYVKGKKVDEFSGANIQQLQEKIEKLAPL